MFELALGRSFRFSLAERMGVLARRRGGTSRQKKEHRQEQAAAASGLLVKCGVQGKGGKDLRD